MVLGLVIRSRKDNLEALEDCLGEKYVKLTKYQGLPGGSDGKESACSAGDLGLTPGLGRSSAEGNGNPLQYSSLENSMDRGAWWATVHGVT